MENEDVKPVEAAAEELPEQLEEAEETAEEAKDAINEGNTAVAEARIAELEGQIRDLVSEVAGLRSGLEGKADKGHEHPLPDSLSHLHEALEEVDAEDMEPDRTHWLYKRRGGR